MTRPMKGKGTITYDDGFSMEVDADIRFVVTGGKMSGSGIIRNEKVLLLAMKEGQPILSCAGQRYRVFVGKARGDGVAAVSISGPPLD